MKYKVIAEPITAPMFYEAASEDEAWKMAEQNAKRIGVRLYNGTVEAVPTKADLEARVKELEAALKQMTDEFKMDDHNLHYPRCNCQSHQNYHAARALLAQKG